MRRGERELWVNTEGKTAVSKLLYPGEAPALLGRADKISRSEEEREACWMLGAKFFFPRIAYLAH